MFVPVDGRYSCYHAMQFVVQCQARGVYNDDVSGMCAGSTTGRYLHITATFIDSTRLVVPEYLQARCF